MTLAGHPRPAIRVTVACRHCGASFQAKEYTVSVGCARYCSRGCATEGRRKINPSKQCERCGAEILNPRISPSREGKGRFCSRGCAYAWLKDHHSIPLKDRFWNHVLKTDNCWLWTGFRTKYGYGVVVGWKAGTKARFMAHRVAWELLRGDVPAGLSLDHLCRVRHCVNPDRPISRDKPTVSAGMSSGATTFTSGRIRECAALAGLKRRGDVPPKKRQEAKLEI